jgi:hypothetical protein
MKKLVTIAMLVGCAAIGAVAQAAPAYVGSFKVDDGPAWTTNPPVYSGKDAAALLFGGAPSDYAISTNANTTNPGTITNTAWYDGWGESCTEYADTYKLDVNSDGYQNPGGTNTARSAYVSDHGCGQVNYVWRLNGQAQAAQIPTMNLPALMSLAGLLAVFGIRRLRSTC